MKQGKMIAVAGALALTAITGGTAAASAPATPNTDYCTPADQRYYQQTSSAWYAYDAGTLVNTSAGTISKTYTHTSTKTLTTTVAGDLGMSVDFVVASVNTKLNISASNTASNTATYTTTTTFTVTAPAHTTVSYTDGILKRTIFITWNHTYSNCTVKTVKDYAYLADNYSVAK